uniref:Uncharacterized protein n=1 Tax=Eutreptiella gymnastica TaxID=73025 RepID=A0A7S4D1Y3_9EUGL
MEGGSSPLQLFRLGEGVKTQFFAKKKIVSGKVPRSQRVVLGVRRFLGKGGEGGIAQMELRPFAETCASERESLAKAVPLCIDGTRRGSVGPTATASAVGYLPVDQHRPLRNGNRLQPHQVPSRAAPPSTPSCPLAQEAPSPSGPNS